MFAIRNTHTFELSVPHGNPLQLSKGECSFGQTKPTGNMKSNFGMAEKEENNERKE